jgi:hypothetical protein
MTIVVMTAARKTNPPNTPRAIIPPKTKQYKEKTRQLVSVILLYIDTNVFVEMTAKYLIFSIFSQFLQSPTTFKRYPGKFNRIVPVIITKIT